MSLDILYNIINRYEKGSDQDKVQCVYYIIDINRNINNMDARIDVDTVICIYFPTGVRSSSSDFTPNERGVSSDKMNKSESYSTNLIVL